MQKKLVTNHRARGRRQNDSSYKHYSVMSTGSQKGNSLDKKSIYWRQKLSLGIRLISKPFITNADLKSLIVWKTSKKHILSNYLGKKKIRKNLANIKNKVKTGIKYTLGQSGRYADPRDSEL
tara:strand:- start:1127 stop:1492 length:366 start_codon:yes stop_codon:yes gene_type:complete